MGLEADRDGLEWGRKGKGGFRGRKLVSCHRQTVVACQSSARDAELVDRAQ